MTRIRPVRPSAFALHRSAVAALVAVLPIHGLLLAGVTITDISPDVSEVYKNSGLNPPSCPEGNAVCANGSGGRVNNLACDVGPGQNVVIYAASEWGGLFKSADGGRNWDHLPGHVPVATEDVAVAVDPSDPSVRVVYATSRYDGRADPRSGIQVSRDGGVTWTHPDTAVPKPGVNTPAGFSCSQGAAIREPAAFGIGIRPDSPQTVVVGTNCGVAVSADSGMTWSYRDPTASTPAPFVWDVVVQAGGSQGMGIIDICGDDGHWRSQDGGTTWTGGGMWWLAGSKCSIAASPDEPDVMFITGLIDDTDLNNGMCDDPRTGEFCWVVNESDDGGASWHPIGGAGRPPDTVAINKNRIPLVVTNDRFDSAGVRHFDLWFGDENIFRAGCQSPPPAGRFMSQRCEPPSAWTEVPLNVTYHGDMGDVVFDPRLSVDACPVAVASDGGTYYLDPDDPAVTDCQSPEFHQPARSVHALWLWGMDGANQPGDAVDLYFGTQDVGAWATRHAEAQNAAATWRDDTNLVNGGDAMSMAADAQRIVYHHFSGGGLFLQNPGMTGPRLSIDLDDPDGDGKANVPVAFQFAPAVARFADKEYVILSPAAEGVSMTKDITAATVQWTRLGTEGDGCGIRASISPDGTPVFYLQKLVPGGGGCLGNGGNGLYRYEGIDSTHSWQRVDTNPVIRPDGSSEPQSGGIGIFGVDPTNANRLCASNLRSDALGGPRMVCSQDGGATWKENPALDRMMTGNGSFRYRNDSGPTGFSGFGGYTQPSLVAFDPDDPSILVAAGLDSGVFISSNGGRDWGLLTDPLDPGTSQVPHIPRPWHAHFQHNSAGNVEIYLGTQGRGVWRIDIAGTDLSVSKGGSPDPVVTGSDLTYTIQVDNNGPSSSGSLTLTDTLPSELAFQSLSAPSGWSCVTPSTPTGGSVTCTRQEAPAGSAYPFTIVSKVDCSVADGTVLSNQATIATPLPDPAPDNNSALATTAASNPAPVIICPGDIEVECTGNCGIQADDPQLVPFFAGASASDNCPGVLISNDAPAFLPLGATIVTFTAIDSGGASASCTATVNVVDTTPPQITVDLDRDVLWPPNHKLVDIGASVRVTDVCDPHPTFVLSSIVSSEPDNGLADGDTPDDIQGEEPGTPDTAFRLRSERSALGGGRVYTIVYTASDKSGNATRATATVSVPHDQSGKAGSGAGFNSLGTDFLSRAKTFDLVVVSTPFLDTRRIDPASAQVGRTAGVIDALRSRLADVSGDGVADLIVTYSVADARRVQAVSGDGNPLAFRYGIQGGSYFLVGDIFRLGRPLQTKP